MITDYGEAVRYLDRVGHGTVVTLDGKRFTGILDDIQSPINDPDEIGYLTLRIDGRLYDIYENQFAGVIEE